MFFSNRLPFSITKRWKPLRLSKDHGLKPEKPTRRNPLIVFFCVCVVIYPFFLSSILVFIWIYISDTSLCLTQTNTHTHICIYMYLENFRKRRQPKILHLQNLLWFWVNFTYFLPLFIVFNPITTATSQYARMPIFSRYDICTYIYVSVCRIQLWNVSLMFCYGWDVSETKWFAKILHHLDYEERERHKNIWYMAKLMLLQFTNQLLPIMCKEFFLKKRL